MLVWRAYERAKISMKKICEGEIILGAWSRRVETSSGVTDGFIKLFVPDDQILDVFQRFQEEDFRGKKREGGKLFKVVFFEYEDIPEEYDPTEEFVPPETNNVKLSQIAAIIGSDPLFPAFCKKFFGDCIRLLINDSLWNGTTIERAAILIRYICSIDSRSQLDVEGDPSIQIFHDLIREPLRLWRNDHFETSEK